MEKYITDELDIVFNERYNLALEYNKYGLYDESDKLFKQCYIYYSSLGQDTVHNFNKAKMCMEWIRRLQ